MFSGGILGSLDDLVSLAKLNVQNALLDVSTFVQDSKTKVDTTEYDPVVAERLCAKMKGTWDYRYNCPKLPDAVVVEDIVDNILRLGDPETTDIAFEMAIENTLKNKKGDIKKAFQSIKKQTSSTEKEGWIKMLTEEGNPIWVNPSVATAFGKSVELKKAVVSDPEKLKELSSLITSRVTENDKFPINTIEEFKILLEGSKPDNVSDPIPFQNPVENNIPGGKYFGDVIKENLENMVSPMQPTQNNV